MSTEAKSILLECDCLLIGFVLCVFSLIGWVIYEVY